MLRATIFDYGAGNLHSLGKALELAGARVSIEPDPGALTATDLLVLPGVGAFATAAEQLAPALDELRAAVAAGLPCLGICLGMQLLFESSEEGPGRGLGILGGRVTRLEASRVPHIGWNRLENSGDRLFERAPIDLAYFANGYACRPDSPSCVIAWTTHESDRFPAAVRRGDTVGFQFHPEKSSRAGLALLAALVADLAGAGSSPALDRGGRR